MFLLPIENIVYKTSLSKAEISERLNDFIKTKGMYIGGCSDSFFWMQRKRPDSIFYKKSYRPEIKGRIEEKEEGSIIKVNMKPNIVVLILYFIIIGLSFYIAILCFVSAIKDDFDLFLMIPLGMFLCTVIFTYISFKIICLPSKKHLLEILEAKID